MLPNLMQKVTCFQCAHETTIAPNAYLCANCGEDLQHLLLPETVAEYFQARAHESSERGELGAALAEAERGLTYADSSELHLLAAILSKQLGRHDRMRQHVAAISLDDTLRSEAEWLLRSHQDRERALQEAARHAPSPLPVPLPVDADPSQPFLEELLGVPSPEGAINRRASGQAVASVAIVVFAAALVAVSWWWMGPGTLASRRASNEQLPVAVGAETSQPTALATTQPLAVVNLPTPTVTAVAVQSAPAVQQVMQTAVLLPTATPTPVDSAAQVADANPSRVVLVDAVSYDIRQYLRDRGFAALAELAIDARMQGETLMLQGFVHLDLQRRELLEIAQSIPGVREVNSVNLLLRPLPTYTVQDGDTLWSVVFNIYGNVDRLDEFAVYNRDVLPSPDALAPGMELKVLPVQ